MQVDSPQLVNRLERLSLNPSQTYVASINKTKFQTGMASKHGNELGVTILKHVKMLHLGGQLDGDKIDDLIKTTKSEYLQRKSLSIFKIIYFYKWI